MVLNTCCTVFRDATVTVNKICATVNRIQPVPIRCCSGGLLQRPELQYHADTE
jgi:hypothetical protein